MGNVFTPVFNYPHPALKISIIFRTPKPSVFWHIDTNIYHHNIAPHCVHSLFTQIH